MLVLLDALKSVEETWKLLEWYFPGQMHNTGCI